MADSDYETHELLREPEATPPPETAQVADEANQPRDERGRFVSDGESEPADEGEVVEASSEDEPPPEDQGESDETDDQEDKEDRSQRRRSARERISQLTRQRREAEARAEQAERERSELLEYLQQQIDPNMEFEDPAKFTQVTVRKALAEQRLQDRESEIERSQAQTLASNQQMFAERVEAMRGELPEDFDQVFTINTPITAVGAEFLAESEVGPLIAHHLGKNPSLASRIAALPPAKQGVELARLEAKLATPPPKRTTKAPKPAKPIQATGPAGTFDPGRSSVDDFKRAIYGRG